MNGLRQTGPTGPARATSRHPIKSTRPRSAISAELGRPNSLGRRVMRLAASVR